MPNENKSNRERSGKSRIGVVVRFVVSQTIGKEEGKKENDQQVMCLMPDVSIANDAVAKVVCVLVCTSAATGRHGLTDFRSDAGLANSSTGTSILKCKFRKPRLNGAMHI